MTYVITHQKTNAISDWTQAELDEQIALGNYPPGTTLADIVLPSDWNDDHTITGSTEWGEITGTLSAQTDLQTALNSKQDVGTCVTSVTGTANRITSTGGTTPVLDIGTDVVTLTGSQTLTNKTITITDNLFTLSDNASPTKLGTFNVSQVTAGSTRDWSFPNITATIAHLGNAPQTFAGQTTWTSAVLNLGTPAIASTVNIATGATTTGVTKAVNIGTAGLSGSTTNIAVGSAVSGSLGTLTINSPTVNFSSLNTAINVSYLTASSIVATDASKNLISVPLVPTTITVAAETLDSQCFAGFFTTTTGDLQPKTINAIRADATTGDFYVQGSAATRTARLGGDGRGYMRYDDNSSSTALYIENRNISAGANRGVSIVWNLADDTTTTAIAAGSIGVLKEQVWTTTTSTQDAYMLFGVANDGSVVNRLRLYASTAALTPNANDGTALGTTALGWSDLFMASGATININNGNWVATHSSGILTVGTGDLRVTTAGTNAASVVTCDGTQTLNNKRINPRVVSTASSATPTPDIATTDQYNLTALATNATFGAPTGTPLDGQLLTIRIKDNGTIRTLAYNGIYRAVGVTLPVVTVSSKTFYLQMTYNSADTKWDVIDVKQEA